MGNWEVFTKQARTVSASPRLAIGKKLGRCALNRAAAIQFDKEGIENVLLLWDQQGLRIGLKGANKKDPRAFPIRISRTNDKEAKITGAAFSGVTFLRHIGYDLSTTHSYPITWDADETVFEVQLAETDFAPNQQSLMAVQGGKKHGKAAG
jgi:hypothetical protein